MTITKKKKSREIWFSFYFCNSLFLHIIFYSLPGSLPAQFDNVQVFVDDQPVRVVAGDRVVDVLRQQRLRVLRVQRVLDQPRLGRQRPRRRRRRGGAALCARASSTARTIAASAAAARRAARRQVP